jgi:hypothetical protein
VQAAPGVSLADGPPHVAGENIIWSTVTADNIIWTTSERLLESSAILVGGAE